MDQIETLVKEFAQAIDRSEMSTVEIAWTLNTNLAGLNRIRSGLYNEEITFKQRQEIQKFVTKVEKIKREQVGSIFVAPPDAESPAPSRFDLFVSFLKNLAR